MAVPIANIMEPADWQDREMERLEAENAKLLDQKADAYNDMVIARLDADELQAEIAMLKELVRDMWGFIEGTDEDSGDVTFSSCFDYCKHDTADDGCSKTGECWYEQRMRELGVEV